MLFIIQSLFKLLDECVILCTLFVSALVLFYVTAVISSKLF